jgi:DNA invertase Pin-like site-specific DNA recombinase
VRAVGVIRVSQIGARTGESFRSPGEQRQRIEEACGRDGLELVEAHEEIDVSGGTPLAERHGLRAAVEAIEGGEAEVLMVAYFDRLVRSLRVQGEVVQRVEAAGGRVLALDVGDVSEATAAKWVQGTMLGMMSEYYRRSIGERVGAAQAQAVDAGVWPSRLPFGYLRGEDGVLVPDPATAPLVSACFTLRADGASVRALQRYLAEQGVERQHGTIAQMLSRRVYLGEIHFGELVNLEAHSPLISLDLWRRVQGVRVPRGPLARSPRLLARLGVLRCGTCGARMSVGGRRKYPAYRCTPSNDCPRPAQIQAHVAEGVVVEAVRAALADVTGKASSEQDAREAVAVAEQAQADLDAAIRAFSGLADEPSATERLGDLRRARDEAVDRAEQLGGLRASYTVDVAAEWDALSVEGQRDLIRAVVARAIVTRGRGPGRITVELFT